MKREDFGASVGLARSLAIYYRPFRIRQLARFYSAFIRPGDLCFDIGAHVGNRVAAWLRLGAAIVAVEPLPACMRLLRHWYGARYGVTLVEQAVAATAGVQPLLISSRTPTVTTLSRSWSEAVGQAPSFAGVRWETTTPVEVTTLDSLIAAHGAPTFCKIDVEGFEPDVLAGLSQALPQLSFEMVPATADLAVSCIQRLQALGDYTYNFSPGESLTWRWPKWVEVGDLLAWLAGLAIDAPSGDIYACRQGAG